MGHKAQVIGRLREAAALLAIAGEYARCEAFSTAAGIITDQGPREDLVSWLRDRRLEAQSVWEEFAWAEALDCALGRRSGTVERLRSGLPPEVVRLLRIRGMSPHRISRAWREFGIDGLPRLKEAMANGELAQSGLLDPATLSQFPRIVAEYEEGCQGWLKPVVSRVAGMLKSYLSQCADILSVAQVGEAAHFVPVAESVELLVAAEDGARVVNWIERWPHRVSTLSHGASWVSCSPQEGIPCVVSWCEPESFALEAYRLSSSTTHWQSLLRLAWSKGYEPGKDGTLRDAAGRTVELVSQEDLARLLGIELESPELRIGPVRRSGEPASGTPVTVQDIRGDLHCHSTFSDGVDAADVMLEVAAQRGYEYLAITDHTQSTWIASGLRERDLPAYLEALGELRNRPNGIRLLTGLEVDILEDGRLDMPDWILEKLDVVIASIHSDFHLPSELQLRRMVRAMEHPLVHALAHPTGRLLGRRSSLPVPLEAIVDAAARTGSWLELNSNPERLDLWDEGLRQCRNKGVPVLVSSDAHRGETLSQVEWGVQEARRAGLQPDDIVNTRPLPMLLEMLAQKRTTRT